MTEGAPERNKFLGIRDSGYHPIRKVKVVVSGLRFAMLHDFSVAYKVYTSLVLIVAAGAFQEWVDFIVILLATGLVLTAELLNSAVEGVCDYLEPGPDPRIGTIKDVAAAAVGISILIWLTVIGLEVYRLLARS